MLVMAMLMVAGGKIGSMIDRLVVLGILLLTRRLRDVPPETRRRFDVVGAVLAAVGLGTGVYGILRPRNGALFLSVSLGLSARETGARILPLSITLLAAAVGIPRFLPKASPRTVVRLGLLAMLAGIAVLLAAIDPSADARIVTIPLLLAGLGIGAIVSQLGAVTVSAVPDELIPEVGGLQTPPRTWAPPSGRPWRVHCSSPP